MPTQTELERRIEELVATIERERTERRAESEAATARIATLEAKLNATNRQGLSGGSPAARPAAAGSPAAKTPPSAARSSAPRASAERAPSQQDDRASARSGGAKTASTGKFSKASSTPSKGGSAAKQQPQPTGEELTAPQAAWDKLCALVKDDFTVKELWLVSLDTLRQLLVHYGVNDPIECAQIEAQWALLQEGKERVERPTLKKTSSTRSKPFVPAKHTGDFDLRPDKGRPSLSKRNALGGDGERTSNPNDLTAGRRSVSPGSKGGVHVDPVQGSNPNDSVSPLRSLRGRKTWDSPGTTIYRDDRRPHGRSRSHSPLPEALTAYPNRDTPGPEGGVKRFSERATPESKQRGLKTGYTPPAAAPKAQSLRTDTSGGGSVSWSVSHGH